MLELRPYQKECLKLIHGIEPGSYLIRLATGLGKTVVFSNIKRQGRMLILSHREELVWQPKKYFNCTYGVEQSNNRSNGEEVVSASVQSIVRRLENFSPDDFDTVIIDEAHHSCAKTYRKILDYFNPRLRLGFTATPNRFDQVRLDDIYSDIIYDKDLKWGIKQGYLSDINCLRANIGFNLSQVARRMGDYAPGELEKAMNVDSQNKAIAEAYEKYGKGQTLIFATSVEHAHAIANEIEGAVVVSAETKDRQSILTKFTNREIPVLVNCMIFTEGTDIPLIETIIIARPTQNSSLYAQMVGRGLRLSEGKDKLQLIDCVGVTGKVNICTAPSLIGIDLKDLPEGKENEIEGDLFDLPELVIRKADCPESWIKNVEIVDLWAKEQAFNTHNINFFKMPDSSLVLSLPDKKSICLPGQDELGRTVYNFEKMDMQRAIDLVFVNLRDNYSDCRALWDLNAIKRWGQAPASDAQLKWVKRKAKGFDTKGLTKMQAGLILNRVLAK